jgi:hypothetical protein
MSNPNPSPSTRFKAGFVANPGGRPRIVGELRESCREVTPAVIERLKAEVAESGPEWLAASKVLLAYGWGTPRQSIDVARSEDDGDTLEGEITHGASVVAPPPDAERLRRIVAILVRSGALTPGEPGQRDGGALEADS